MTLRGIRTRGAFGEFNSPTTQTGERLRAAFCKAKERVLQQSQPTTKRFPLSALRRQFSNILGLDVIFSPRLKATYRSSTSPDSRLPSYKTYEISPVWKTAPEGAVWKADKFSSMLHTIVTDGWKANIVHLLVQLAKNIWRMSRRDFNGLCRKILSRIYKASSEDVIRKSPDPLLRFSALSRNPIANCYCVSRFENRSRANARKYGVNRLPQDLGLRAHLLSTLWYEAQLRRTGLRRTT